MAYRMGIKYNFKDSDGDDATLIVHFFNPVYERGIEVTKERTEEIFNNCRKAMDIFAQKAAQLYGSVVTVSMQPPEYMFKELEQTLKALREK